MCGRYTLATPTESLADLFRLQSVPALKPRYNIAPTQPVLAVRLSAEGEREMVVLHWGFIPSWAKDPDKGIRMINARSETVAQKPAFRSAFKHRRCLIPTDGFYEWQKVTKRKQPHYIHMKGGGPFAFAGLWETWEGPDNLVIESCTILTTEPNEFVRPLHNRMPVIIDPEDYDGWLGRDAHDLDTFTKLLQPYAGDMLTTIPVSTFVNNPRNDEVRCIEPIE